jgi:hypothetical protein
MGEGPPIKAGQPEPSSHLTTTCENHHINKEQNVLISGTREKSAVGDSAEHKEGSLLFQLRQYFTRRGDFNCRKDFTIGLISFTCKDFPIRLIFSGSKDFPIRLIFSTSKDFPIRLIFSSRKDFPIRLIFTGRKYL